MPLAKVNATWSIPRDSNPQQPRCKRGTLTNCVRNRKSRHSSYVPELVDIKICFAVCAVNGWSGQIRTVECMCIRHVCLPPSPHSNKIKMHAINAIYWIRTNVSSIAASALTTKLNARMVDTNVTLLYASLKSTRSKWPNHYDSLLYHLSYVLTFLERTAGLKPATNGFECKMNIAVWILNGRSGGI